jgi:hypothetical protein
MFYGAVGTDRILVSVVGHYFASFAAFSPQGVKRIATRRDLIVHSPL